MPTSPHAQPSRPSMHAGTAPRWGARIGRRRGRALAALLLAAGVTIGATGCAQATTTSAGSPSIEASDLERIASGNKSPAGASSTGVSATSGPSGAEKFVVPEAAKAHTKQGAVAFVKFYWNMLGELDIHPQVGVIPRFASADCKSCKRQEETMVTFVKQGARVVTRGAALSNERVRTDSTQDSVVVQFHQTTKGAEKFTQGKRTETQAPVSSRIELRADWVGTEWKLGEEGSLDQ